MKNQNKKLDNIVYKCKYLDKHIIDVLELKYNEYYRYYHNIDHINYMIKKMLDDNLYSDELLLAILYHDLVYNPKKEDNEYQSALLFQSHMKRDIYDNVELPSDEVINDIMKSIMSTRDHEPYTELSKNLCYLDFSILNEPFDVVLEYEKKIFKEYQWVDWNIYKSQRTVFLELYKQKIEYLNKENIDNLIAYLDTKVPNIGVYAGSFNPFHKGHLNILEKAERVFDKVIIAKGNNPDKENDKQFLDQFTERFKPEEFKYRDTKMYIGLLTDFIKNLGYKVTLVRGLRNTTDLQAELNQYRYIKQLMPELEMVSFYCDAEFEHISSSAIKSIAKYPSVNLKDYIIR